MLRHPHKRKSANLNPLHLMNTMLELSMDATYDTAAAFLIFTGAIAAKLWFNYKSQAVKSQGLQH